MFSQRRVEAHVLRLQLFLALLQQRVLLCQLIGKMLLLGDILMRYHPTAVPPRLNHRGDHTPVRESVDEVGGRLARKTRAHHLQYVVGLLTGIVALGYATLDNLLQRSAGLHMLAIEAENLGVAVVGDDNALVGIEHGQALHHALQGGIEPDVLRFQRLLPVPQQLVGPFELPERAIDHLQWQHGECHVGRNTEEQGDDSDQENFPEQRTQTGGNLGVAEDGVG